jgi:hypothetical protein
VFNGARIWWDRWLRRSEGPKPALEADVLRQPETAPAWPR